MKIIVEGNIGSGKSSLIKRLNKGLKRLGHDTNTYIEPVDQWNNNDYAKNLLKKFYQDPRRYGFHFQLIIFATNMLMWNDIQDVTRHDNDQVQLIERFILSPYDCFTRTLLECNMISNDENNVMCIIYKVLFNIYMDKEKNVNKQDKTIIIYLKCFDTELLLKRIKKRGRVGEKGVTKEYLESLNENLDIMMRGLKEKIEQDKELRNKFAIVEVDICSSPTGLKRKTLCNKVLNIIQTEYNNQ